MELDVRLDLGLNVRKHDFCHTSFDDTAFETFNFHFPSNEYFDIYTDRCLLDFSQSAGASVFSNFFFPFYLHAESLTTHFNGATYVTP